MEYWLEQNTRWSESYVSRLNCTNWEKHFQRPGDFRQRSSLRENCRSLCPVRPDWCRRKASSQWWHSVLKASRSMRTCLVTKEAGVAPGEGWETMRMRKRQPRTGCCHCWGQCWPPLADCSSRAGPESTLAPLLSYSRWNTTEVWLLGQGYWYDYCDCCCCCLARCVGAVESIRLLECGVEKAAHSPLRVVVVVLIDQSQNQSVLVMKRLSFASTYLSGGCRRRVNSRGQCPLVRCSSRLVESPNSDRWRIHVPLWSPLSGINSLEGLCGQASKQATNRHFPSVQTHRRAHGGKSWTAEYHCIWCSCRFPDETVAQFGYDNRNTRLAGHNWRDHPIRLPVSHSDMV